MLPWLNHRGPSRIATRKVHPMSLLPALTRRSVLGLAPVALTLGLGSVPAALTASDHPFSTAAQIAFHDAMRKLWEDRMT